MSDTTKEYAFYIIGLLALIVPLLRELLKNKKWIKSKIFRTFYMIFLVLTFVTLLYLGIDKINRDGLKDLRATDKINKLDTQLQTVIVNDSIFKKRLSTHYQINDSANYPVQNHNMTNVFYRPNKVDISN
jgi:hypothetical protein